MGGGDQFFRVGARLRFKTRGKRIRGAFQDSAGRSERAFAVFQSATPMCACIPLHELFCSSNEIGELYTGSIAFGACVKVISIWSSSHATDHGALYNGQRLFVQEERYV